MKKDAVQLNLINQRLKELELLDESKNIRDIPRREWKNKEIKNKFFLWQIKPKTAKTLFYLVKKNQPKIILELGTSAGYSSLIFAKATLASKNKIHTIECSKYRINLAEETFRKTGLEKKIILHKDKIANVLNVWDPKKKIDMLFLDADKENYSEYVKKLFLALSKKALIVADNVLDNPKKTAEFIQFMKNQKDFKTTIKRIDNGVLISKRINIKK